QERGLATFTSANTIADHAATLEEPGLLQILDVRPPGRVVGSGVIVHQQEVLAHLESPNFRQSGCAPVLQRLLDDNRSKAWMCRPATPSARRPVSRPRRSSAVNVAHPQTGSAPRNTALMPAARKILRLASACSAPCTLVAGLKPS